MTDQPETDKAPKAAAPGFIWANRPRATTRILIAVRAIDAVFPGSSGVTHIRFHDDSEGDSTPYHGTPEQFADAIADAHKLAVTCGVTW